MTNVGASIMPIFLSNLQKRLKDDSLHSFAEKFKEKQK